MRKQVGWMAAAALALALAACGNADKAMTDAEESASGFAVAPADAEMGMRNAAPPMAPGGQAAGEMQDAAAQPSPAPGPNATPSPGAVSPAPILYLAYQYFVGIELPAANLAGVLDAHIQACVTAGPRLCQLVNSSREGDPESDMRGALMIRGEPQWLRGFRAGLEGDAQAANGRIRQQSTNTEDLTRQIVDTEASLRASRTLRDRLQRLLESRPGRLSDLLEVERELSRVQAQIDATESGLAVMRTRVAMSELTVNYMSQPRAVGSNTFEPLTNAFASFLGLVVEGTAAIVTGIAAILPGAIFIALLVWLALFIRRRRGGRFVNREPQPARPAPDASS